MICIVFRTTYWTRVSSDSTSVLKDGEAAAEVQY
jgi:hypothetical protein